MAHYLDRKRSTAQLGAALAARGWDLLGYHADKSDSQTDYYDPARWDGIARRGGLLLLVDLDSYHSQHWQEPHQMWEVVDGPCCCCAGTGTNRSGDQTCAGCAGAGHRRENRVVRTEQPPDWTDHLRPCVGRWMLLREGDGKVLSTGQRHIAGYGSEGQQAVTQRDADDIERAAGT